ncbi:MAG: SUMF1/EgtB/PvdO family nonheme iron enzyme, partial [Deltaproteobacteria bacterium]|nr:SUMF1/EgtB/PvdO family nonheme iron enzyme [Deltaproteobacteria bacterium]
RIGLSATVADPPDRMRWLVAQTPGRTCEAGLVTVEGGAKPDISILHTEDRIPWSGHSARYAIPDLYAILKRFRTTLVFVNTRSQAELLFQELWTVNDDNLPIALHHGSLDVGQRRKVEAYCVDVYEYPNQQGRAPLANVTWARAKKACEKVGKRLCSEMEWERACKGPDSTRFPFGDEFVASACNVSGDSGGLRRPSDAGAFSRCRSGFGAVDMAGNVAEWTASQWSKEVPDKVVKGGSADQAAFMARCAARVNESTGSHRSTLGFRCCAEVR